MPKTLVLTTKRSDDTAALAAVVAEGVAQVRFAEVDVRHADDMDSMQEVMAYDAIVLGITSGEGAMAEETRRMLERLAAVGEPKLFAHKVGSVFTAGPAGDDTQATKLWSAMAAMGSIGMVLVPPAPVQDADAARALGKRVAEVTGWITHARSHHHH